MRLALVFAAAVLACAAAEVPKTSIRVEHYPALKQLAIPGDIVFGVCSRGGPGAVWSEEKCTRALSLLNQVKDPRVEKMLVISSVEDLKWLLARRPPDLVWVAYNSEGGMTPEKEFGNIREAVVEFARVAHAAGLKVIWGPTHVMLKEHPELLELTKNLEGMAFQHQKVLQYEGVDAMIQLTRERAAAVRRYNPACRTTVQVVVGRGTNEQLIQGLKAVAGTVSEVKVFSMRDTAAIGSILTAVRGEGK